MRSRPMRPIVLTLLAATLVVVTGCAQWSQDAPTLGSSPFADYQAGDVIVITAERNDAASQAHAIAVSSFDQQALATHATASETPDPSASNPGGSDQGWSSRTGIEPLPSRSAPTMRSDQP